jgi:hypothetical protein
MKENNQNNTMKTALNQLIEKLTDIHIRIGFETKIDRHVKGAYVDAVMIAKQLLEVEKEQIQDAYIAGEDTEGFGAGSYFNDTFNPNTDEKP